MYRAKNSSNTDSDTYSDTDSDTYSDTDSDTDSNVYKYIDKAFKC